MKHEWTKDELACTRRCRKSVYNMSGEMLSVMRLESRFDESPQYFVKIGNCQSVNVEQDQVVSVLALLAHVALSSSLKADRAHFASLTAALA
jgi:hypothetical protein